jgi:hypothetical protein
LQKEKQKTLRRGVKTKGLILKHDGGDASVLLATKEQQQQTETQRHFLWRTFS